MTFDLNDEMVQALTEQQLISSLEPILRAVRTDKPSLKSCDDCGTDIPEARRLAIRGVQFCVTCQEIREHHQTTGTGRFYGHK